MRLIPFISLLVLLNMSGATYAADSNAEVVFEAVKPAVLQIKTVVKGSESKSSIGSGFLVSPNGLVISNYHVASEYALSPENYEIRYVASNGEEGRLTLLAIDVLHDLALLQRKGENLPYLTITDKAPPKGARGYSIGNPEDVGTTIVEGTNNGPEEHAFYESLHFTGAINPGMSGGPVVDENMRVFGINKSHLIKSQLLGFLVPAHFATDLIQKWQKHPVIQANFKGEVSHQLYQHADNLLVRAQQNEFKTQRTLNYIFPVALDNSLQCWGDVDADKKKFYETRSYFCMGQSALFVDGKTDIGDMNFISQIYSTDQMGPLRFSKMLGSKFQANNTKKSSDAKKTYTPYNCQANLVELKNMPAKVAICTRQFRQYPDLYEIQLKLVSIKESNRALTSQLQLSGVKLNAGMSFVKRYLKAIEWKN